MKRIALLVSALVFCGVACTGVPQPQPVPGLMRRSTPGLTQKKTLLVGLEGAVGLSSKVSILVRGASATVTASASPKGAFSAVLSATAGAILEVSFETADGPSATVTLVPTDVTRGPMLSKGLVFGSAVSAPDAQGIVTVSNDDPTDPPFSASANTQALVSNSRTGELVSNTTDAKGALTVKLAGKTGDQIHILLAEPGSFSTSDFLAYTVP